MKAVGSELRGHPSCEEEGRRCIKVLFDGTRRVTLPVLLDEADAALIVLSSFIRMSLQLPVLCACAVPGRGVLKHGAHKATVSFVFHIFAVATRQTLACSLCIPLPWPSNRRRQ